MSVFKWMNESRKALADWRDRSSAFGFLSGCLVLFALAVLALLMAAGTQMSDYIGPPEGAEANRRAREMGLRLSMTVFAICCATAVWWCLWGRPRR